MRRILLLLSLLLILPALQAVETEKEESRYKVERKIGPYDSDITRNTAQILQRYHYSRKVLDEDTSALFLENYLEALDPQRTLFLESDIKKLEAFKKNLGYLTLRTGNVNIAHEIFNTYLQRLEERQDFVVDALENQSFSFDTDEEYQIIRKDADRPSDRAEARKLWDSRLRHEYLTEKLAKKNHDEIVDALKRRYKRISSYFKTFDGYDVLQLWLSSLARAYDPHTDYMGKHELENFEIQMKLSLFGIGALLQSTDGYCEIVRVMPGGPAFKSKKLSSKDKIVGVAQENEDFVDVIDMPLRKVVEQIRGPKGSTVRLEVIPAKSAEGGERKIISLVRDEIPLEDQEAKAELIETKGADGQIRKLGVIDLPSFYADFNLSNDKKKKELKSTTKDVAKLLEQLKNQNMDGLILDLRRNGGGSLEEAINLTGLFIKKGPVVVVKDTFGRLVNDADEDPTVAYDGPMIVLTSRHSASASEILAGALQDYGRAVIVGEESTHGKGTVQTLYELNRFFQPTRKTEEPFHPGALKLTIRKFYRPSGHSTQRKGIVPDIIYPSVNNHRDIGEAELKNPLPWDIIPTEKLEQEGITYERKDVVSALVPKLKERLSGRITKDQDWKYVQEDIERFKKLKERKFITLNEEQRLSEKDEIETLTDTRREEINGRAFNKFIRTKYELKSMAEGKKPEAQEATDLIEHEEDEDEVPVEEEGDEEEEEPMPVVDVGMKEAKRILIDMLELISAKPAVAASNTK